MNYNIIYADPPWKYNDRRGDSKDYGACSAHYDTLSYKELKVIPIQDISADDCALFLWTTMPFLPDAISLVSDWGFRYRTVAFVWIKTNPKAGTVFKGLGNWTKANAELVLLGTRGKVKRESKKVSQVIVENRGKHSKKPNIVRERIVELVGDLPRIEIFARDRFDGWSCFGNEVDSDLLLF